MIEQLFGSKTRVKLLRLFYANPNRSFYVREITRKIEEQINSVRRELSNLLSMGIIGSDTQNNRLYYEVNQSYEFYRPLSMIFGTGETEAAPDSKKSSKKDTKTSTKTTQHPLEKDIRGIGKVDLALLLGQFTRDESSGVDILIVGDVNQTKAQRFITELEKAENKELRYTILARPDYTYRLQIKDRFIYGVLASKKQIIIDDQALPADF